VFRRLQGRCPDARLAVVGCGRLEPALRAKSEALGLVDRVIWMGPRTPPEIADLMAAADVLLLTSAFEAMPVAVLEALACGLPVVSPDLGEMRNLITDDAMGLLTASRDPEDLAASAAAVLARSRPAGGVFSRIGEFAAETVFRKLELELRELARPAAGDPS